jgi:hypothetical protein
MLAAMTGLLGCSQGEPASQDQLAPQSGSEAAFSLFETSWTYPNGDGATVLETVDANGNYLSTVDAKVVDRGIVTMVDGKACFDSAGSDAPPNCWLVPEARVGETKDYVDDHGQRLRVTRVAHVTR